MSSTHPATRTRRRRAAVAVVAAGLGVALLALSAGGGAGPADTGSVDSAAAASERPRGGDGSAAAYKTPKWRRSRSLGLPHSDGKLKRGVRLPKDGRNHFTWNAVDRGFPNPAFRRWGSDVLVRQILAVLREFRRDNPDAPRIGIADLSLRRGGDFGSQYGGLGHASHQNGLDADIHYPRLDRRERNAGEVGKIDRELSQDLVDRFVEGGAQYVFVGPNTGLTGPKKVVQPLAHHDNHLHLRIYNTTRDR